MRRGRRSPIRQPRQKRCARWRDRGPDRLSPGHRAPRASQVPGCPAAEPYRLTPRNRIRRGGGGLMLRLAIHHPTELLVVLAVLVLVVLAIRLVIGNPRSARHRTRVLRWRIRLYLRPGPGYANILELAVRWSRLRAVRVGGRSRPSLPWWARLILPVTTYAVRLGRAHLGRRVIAGMEDQMLVLAAPRTGKSGWLADRIIDHPGAVVTTTTRTDLLENTGGHPYTAR